MFLDSGFAPPVPAFPFPVALVNTDPDGAPLVSVCFNREWLPYVVTCLYQLVLQATWDTTDPDALNLVQARAMTLISNFIQGCNPPPPNSLPGAGGDEDMMIRQNPDNPCELQFSVNGTTWCTWADLTLCHPAVTQPGAGAPQPPAGGGQQCYHAIMNASDKWLVPTTVSGGDQIVFSNVTGAGADGGIDGLWYCPNGQTYFAGACIGVPGDKAADVAPTIPHMRLIVQIGGVYYDAYNTSFTVPGGVLDAPVTVQINDSNITDNSGSYQFDVCVTNNQSQTSWEHTFDFATGAHGWTAYNGFATLQSDGWHGVNQHSGTQDLNTLYIILNIPEGANITGAFVRFTNPNVYLDLSGLLRGKDGQNWTGTQTFSFDGTGANHANLSDVQQGAAVTGGAGSKCILVAMNAYQPAVCIFRSVTIQGTGTEPTWS